MTLQVTLKEQEMENPFKTPEDKEVDTQIVIDGSMMGIETPLDIITIALQDKRESNQENPSSHNNNATPPLNKGKAKSNKPQV